MQTEVRMKAQGKVLAEYHNSRSRVDLIMGPLGSGKTIESCQKIFKYQCIQDKNDKGERPSRWCAVRNTYSDLFSTTIKDWLGL
ncbi:MAG: TerL, partial [Candidatus Bathyarchaeia archaeon]